MLTLSQLNGFNPNPIAAAAAFTPSSISDLSLWYDSILGTTAVSTGNPVDTWVAQVGANATSTLTARPTKDTLGGKTCVSFDGTNDEMTISGGPATNVPFTVFALVYRASTMDKFCVFGNTAGSIPIGIYPYQSSGVFFGNSSNYGSGTDLTTGWNYYVATASGSTLTIRRNGANVTLSNSSSSGASSWNRIGRRGSENGKGAIRACGHYNRVLNGTEISQLESYLGGL